MIEAYKLDSKARRTHAISVTKKILGDIIRHAVLLILSFIWLVPVAWLIFSSLDVGPGLVYSSFMPKDGNWTFNNYINIIAHPDTVANFPTWFMNTLIVAIFTCLISTIFILCVSYATSKMRFKGRRGMMNFGMLLGLFPGFLSMICVYFILKTLGISGTLYALIIVYSASSGLGYLVAKGYFDTIPNALIEAARIDGASEAKIFFKIVVPLAKPIIVYTIITSFLAPWVDFVFARIILDKGNTNGYTVAIGLYNMLDKTLVNSYFTQFCAGAVLVSIPISILFVLTQKFYVQGATGGAVKG